MDGRGFVNARANDCGIEFDAIVSCSCSVESRSYRRQLLSIQLLSTEDDKVVIPGHRHADDLTYRISAEIAASHPKLH